MSRLEDYYGGVSREIADCITISTFCIIRGTAMAGDLWY